MRAKDLGLWILLLICVACKEPNSTGHRDAAAKWGNRVSQFEKGLAFQEGKEENKSLDNALAWYIASATPTNHVVQKSTETIIDIADLYNVLIRDMSTLNPEMDVDYLKVGENIIIPGHPEAMYFAGVLSESGTENKPSDLFEAAKWYHKGAEAGHAVAQFSYGRALEKGAGVEMNLKKAANWYRLSAEKGIGSAQLNLAGLYFHGHGVDKNLSEAYRWYSLAKFYLNREGAGALSDSEVEQLNTAIKTTGESIGAGERARVDKLIEAFEPDRISTVI